MNHEEILRMNRMSQQDEGLLNVANHGRMIASSVLCLVETIIILFNWITGQPNNIPLCLLFAMLAADTFPYYRFTEEKKYIVITILSTLAALGFLAAHIVQVVMLG